MDGRWPTEPAELKAATHVLLEHSHALSCRILSTRSRRKRVRASCRAPLPAPTASGPTMAKASCASCITRPATEESLLWGQRRRKACGARAHTPTGAASRCFTSVSASRALSVRPQTLGVAGCGWIQSKAGSPSTSGTCSRVGLTAALSNLHRVRMPSAASGDDASRSRYSIGFFLQADKRALIECTQSEPITAGDCLGASAPTLTLLPTPHLLQRAPRASRHADSTPLAAGGVEESTPPPPRLPTACAPAWARPSGRSASSSPQPTASLHRARLG